VAILLVGMVALGWYMISIEHQPNGRWYFNLHKSFGIVTGMLILLRVLWRLSHQLASLPISVPHWQAWLSRLVQGLLYVCMIAMPLTGFVGASFSKHGILFFGYPLPSWVHPDHRVSSVLFDAHGIIAWVLVGLVSLHVLAAFKHLIVNKDGVFQRMWF
jgi:cytochrome b561